MEADETGKLMLSCVVGSHKIGIDVASGALTGKVIDITKKK